jgi:hypothetical protein
VVLGAGDAIDDDDDCFIIQSSVDTGAIILVGIIISVCSKPRPPHCVEEENTCTARFL